MILRKALMSMALGTYVLGATAANAAPAIERAPAAADESLELGQMGSLGWIIALAIAAGVVLVIVTDDDDDDPEVLPPPPVSP